MKLKRQRLGGGCGLGDELVEDRLVGDGETRGCRGLLDGVFGLVGVGELDDGFVGLDGGELEDWGRHLWQRLKLFTEKD